MRNKRMQFNDNDTSRWIVSYADFITLSFAFFVVMYAVSSVNVNKYKNMAEGLQKVFSKQKHNTLANKTHGKTNDKQVLTGKAVTQPDFEHVKKLLGTLKSNNIAVNQHQSWIELDIKASALFTSGQAVVNREALVDIEKIAAFVKNSAYPIALEGHTDDVPINTSMFPSNWELSAARAAAIARLFAANGVDPAKISATGFGAQHPIASNKSKSGRAKNRRVVVIIAKDNSVQRLLNPNLSKRLADKRLQQQFKVKEVKTESGGIKFIRTLKNEEVRQ